MLNSCPPERFAEALFADGFEQIVESVHLKGPQRKLVMRRDENHPRQRNFCRVQRLNDSKAVQPRHLHVKKNQIRPMVFDRRDGRLAPVSLGGKSYGELLVPQPYYLPPSRTFSLP